MLLNTFFQTCTRVRRAPFALLPLFVFAGSADGAEVRWLESDQLRVSVKADFPHVLRYEHRPTGGFLSGTEAGAAAMVEINGETYAAGDGRCRVQPRFERDSARYAFVVAASGGELAFEIVLSLHDNRVRLTLENVREQGGFALRTLQFPGQALLTVQASQPGASVCRAEYSRDPDRGTIRTQGAEIARLGAVQPDSAPRPTHWAMVYTDKVVGTVHTNQPVFPLQTTATGSGATTESVAIANRVYHRRAGGERVPLLASDIVLLGDVNGDRVINWVDGAIWLRSRLPELPAAYEDAFLAKFMCARLPDSRPKFNQKVRGAKEPIVYCTFDQALDRIRRFHHLTDGAARQIVYLVGWQHRGHDDRYPDLSVVNPLLGGREKLVALMEQARAYNAVVSLHVNFDAMYKDSPAWNPDVIRRTREGELLQWTVMHDDPVYHISHYKDVKRGTALQRIDDLVKMLPLRDSIHLDAFRYINESWEPDGFLDLNADLWGCRQIIERFGRHGLTVTVEGATNNPGLFGVIKGAWHTGMGNGPGREFLWFLTHGRFIGGRDKPAERVVFGNSGGEGEDPPAALAAAFYRDAILWSHFRKREMWNVTDDGDRTTVEYRPGCTARFERKTGGLRVVSDGIEIARDGDRFVPVSGEKILAYSTRGGAQEWKLPAGWTAAELHRLTENGREAGPRLAIANGRAKFNAEPGVPYVLSRSGGNAAR